MSEEYRRCVGLIIVNSVGKVLVGQRVDEKKSLWQFPQGGIDAGESPLQAMYRECEEEVGITSLRVLNESSTWRKYIVPAPYRPPFWGEGVIGQTQKWFLAAFTGQPEEVKADTKMPEFQQLRWVNFEQTPELVVSFKKSLYTSLVTEFSPFLKKIVND